MSIIMMQKRRAFVLAKRSKATIEIVVQRIENNQKCIRTLDLGDNMVSIF